MVVENVELEKTGVKKFLESSDSLLGRAADFMDECTFDDVEKLAVLKEVCDIVKITAMSIKALKEGDVKPVESPTEKTKRRANGSQVTV